MAALELRNVEGAERVRTASEAVGASRPVPLGREDKVLLYKVSCLARPVPMHAP
jgi:hypothetical protein